MRLKAKKDALISIYNSAKGVICDISCSGFIVGEYGAIGRFLNGEDSRLFIDSTKL